MYHRWSKAPGPHPSSYTRSIAGNAVANCAHKNGAGTTILIRVYTGVSSTQQRESERRDERRTLLFYTSHLISI